MVITVIALTSGADTASQGAVLFDAITAALSDAPTISVSFDGIATVTSSFTNASFLRFAQENGLGALKTRIRIVNASSQIREMLRNRVANSKSLMLAAA